MTTDAVSDALVVAGVSRSFRSGTQRVDALGEVELELGRGEFVTVIGPSGCGKSTLLRLVAGLLEPDRGSISIFGEPVVRARAEKHIGLVPQSPALLPWRTVLQNVELVLAVNPRPSSPGAVAPAELLSSFGLGDVLDRRPGELSGGMQQRVAVARAFALAPSVLLMDEPFAALDELTRETLRRELLDHWERNQTTVLFVTHSITEAVLLSDRIVVMSGRPGHITATVSVALERPRPAGIEFGDAFRAIELEVRAALRAGSSDAA